MRFRLKALLEKVVDPRGPLGEIVSPSEVYKERLGLPISSPHTLRITHAQAPEFAEHALAPARFISDADAVPPKDRVRQVSIYVEERWTPVYQQPPKEKYWLEPVRVGWTVTQHVRDEFCTCEKAKFTIEDGALVHEQCGRAMTPMGEHAEDFREHALSIGLTAADDSYNVFMPTVPGPDGTMTPYGYVKGGTQIRGGRAEYRDKTKGFAHWDSGTMKEREQAQHRAKVEMQQKLERHTDGAVKAMPTKFVAKAKSVARLRAEGTAP